MELKTAFRWHLQNMPRHRHGFGDGLADAPRAVFALAMARRDVAAGIKRYPAPVKPFPAFGAPHDGTTATRWSERPESNGLRLVGRVMPECGRSGIWDDSERCGWYADESQDNVAFGLVYQLPGRNGQARFVAGYAMRDDCGVSVDLGRIFAEPAAFWEPVRKSATGYVMGGYWNYSDNPRDMDSAHDAARAADGMARCAAESERDYQTAWSAGQLWADHGDDIAATRAELLAILKERRAAKSHAGFPALCDAIRARVADLLADITRRRAERAELAEGDYRNLTFWNGDAALRAAFCDGADITTFPA